MKNSQGVHTTREENALCINAEGVDDCVVAGEVVHEGAFGALPFLDVVAPRGARCE